MKIDWDHLRKLSKMETEEDAKAFDHQVWEIASTKDAILLEHLIDLFDDECEYPEVMYSLVHAIETYPDKIYFPVLLKKFSLNFEKAKFWFIAIFYRILNHQPSVVSLGKYLHLAPKESLLKLFDLMEKESPHHKELIQGLRKKLEKKP